MFDIPRYRDFPQGEDIPGSHISGSKCTTKCRRWTDRHHCKCARLIRPVLGFSREPKIKLHLYRVHGSRKVYDDVLHPDDVFDRPKRSGYLP